VQSGRGYWKISEQNWLAAADFLWRAQLPPEYRKAQQNGEGTWNGTQDRTFSVATRRFFA